MLKYVKSETLSRIELALQAIMRDFCICDEYAKVIADNIARWYYITALTWDNATALMIEYCTKGTLSLTGKL